MHLNGELEAILEPRRKRAEKAWALTDEIVLVGAGSPIGIPGGFDQCYDYRPHPQYRWLTESSRPGSVVAFDPQEGWLHFVVPVSEHERVWDGERTNPSGGPREELSTWLEARSVRKVATLGGPIDGVAGDRLGRRSITRAARYE